MLFCARTRNRITPCPPPVPRPRPRRCAIAFWRIAHFDTAPKIRPPVQRLQRERADPLTTFDVRPFNVVRGQQAQIGREIRSCLADLPALRKDVLARTFEPGDKEGAFYTNDCPPRTSEPGDGVQKEPETAVRNEPKDPWLANDDTVPAIALSLRNEPDAQPPSRIVALRATIMAEQAARFIMDGLMRGLGEALAIAHATAG